MNSDPENQNNNFLRRKKLFETQVKHFIDKYNVKCFISPFFIDLCKLSLLQYF